MLCFLALVDHQKGCVSLALHSCRKGLESFPYIVNDTLIANVGNALPRFPTIILGKGKATFPKMVVGKECRESAPTPSDSRCIVHCFATAMNRYREFIAPHTQESDHVFHECTRGLNSYNAPRWHLHRAPCCEHVSIPPKISWWFAQIFSSKVLSQADACIFPRHLNRDIA